MQRARTTFWALVAIGVAAAGTLSRSLAATPRAVTGVAVALSGLVLTVASLLALRILLVLERPHWQARRVRDRD